MELHTLYEEDLNLEDGKHSQRVPKIIHQTYKNATIPEGWQEPYESCRAINAGYEFILWTDEKMSTFIKEYYPWFIPTYEAYPYSIQRVDAFRYFVIYHYGG
jgi:mannosyltransferase OCH1-like enzyme